MILPFPLKCVASRWLLRTFLGTTLFSIACNTTGQPPVEQQSPTENPTLLGPPYKAFSGKIQQKIDQTCKNLGITHFVVRNQIVFVRKESTGEEIPLHHFRPVMPNGYYYCTKQSLHKSDLE